MAKILIVDDSPTDRALIRETLESGGHQIASANDGSEALGAIERENPDLVLLDVVMPGENGFKVCRALKKKMSSLRVVLVTSKDGESDKFWGMKQGADGYITKPFEAAELLQTVRQFV
ncbi:MAG: response regulator [Acidobacteriota bacterium]